ncbi:hypothetical protein GCM10022206_09880 [Streptomyces chiangmaiensis]
MLSPHTPQGGGGTSSSKKHAPSAPGEQEDVVRRASDEQVQAASEFLIELKRPWAVGVRWCPG